MSRPMHGLDGIELAFSRVRASAKRAIEGDKESKDESLEDIFALNNEIGRLGRQSPEMMPKMKEMQTYVNMITVGLKYGRTKELLEGIALTEESIKAVKKKSTTRP